MEQILIHKPNGDTEAINSISKVSAITQAEHRKTLLGDDIIVMTVESAEPRDFGIGDTIKILNLPTYRINQLPGVTKVSERKFVYELTFEGLQYDLRRATYRNTDVSSFNNAADFSLIGDLEMFLNVLINNLNRVYGADAWVLGDFPEETETKNLLFNSENCLAVLQRLCEEYQYEFVCDQTDTQKILHVREVGLDLEFYFKYGQGKGLYKLTRENVDTKDLVNTLWAYGSDKNLPANYKNYSPRLRLGTTETDAPSLAEDSIELYGTYEGSVIFDEVYPHRTGTVTAIDAEKPLEFVDSAMFDLNETSGGNSLYLIPGNVAKVVFQTGNLAGYEFEVSAYVHATKTFTLKQNKDPKGIDMPSLEEAAFQIQAGDTYVLIDIMMPDSYILAAEEELQAKVTDYLNANAVPTVQYSLEIDEFYLQKRAETYVNRPDVGDTVSIEDEALDINSRIKIVGFTRDILRPFKYNLTIKDRPLNSNKRKLLLQDAENRKLIRSSGAANPVRRRTDWRSDTQIIAEIPEYIENTPVINVGRRSTQTNVGNPTGITRLLGTLGIVNPFDSNGQANINVSNLTTARVVALPDQDIEVNVWDSLIGVPTKYFEQNIPESNWAIVHNFGRKALCQTFNMAGEQVFGDIQQVSNIELHVKFSKNETGYALLMGI